jgi:hypothetical protein
VVAAGSAGIAAGGAGRGSSEFAEGAISLLVSKRCEKSRKLDARGLEWSALVYARAKPPTWGRKEGGSCRGLDTWVMSEALGAGALWATTDHKAIETDPMKTMFDPGVTQPAFKKAFGWELPARGDYVPPADVFLKFDAKKLSAVFDRFYVKPADTIGGVAAQQVYDVFFKEFVTRFAREVALIKRNLPKPQLAKLLKEYRAAAKQQGGKFNGPAHLKQAAATALAKEPEAAARAGRTLGVVLRRTADATWPTVNRLLKNIVTDYDPALAEELGKAL